MNKLITTIIILYINTIPAVEEFNYRDIPDSCSLISDWNGVTLLIPSIIDLENVHKKYTDEIYREVDKVIVAACDTLKVVDLKNKKELIVFAVTFKDNCLRICESQNKVPEFIKRDEFLLIRDVWSCPGDIGKYLFVDINTGDAVDISLSDYVTIKNGVLQWNDNVLSKDELDKYQKEFWIDLKALLECAR